MKISIILAALVTAVLAEEASPPFRLFIKSDNKTLDGQSLGACHEGAAIEGLCPSGSTRANESHPYDTFYLTKNDFAPSPADDPYGVLTWNLSANNGDLIVPSSMRLELSPTTNVALSIISPGNSSYSIVSFSEGGCMYIAESTDDTQSPPVYLDTAKKLENWYICLARYGYLSLKLAWVIGFEGTPQNPSCQKVQIIREFI